MNDWSITEKTLDYINEFKGTTLLELGSGEGTHELSKRWEVYSVEHDLNYVGLYDTNYIYAKIVNGWYDPTVLEVMLEGLNYDLLLIDGPPGHMRKGILNYLDLFNPDVPWIFDDLQRDLDYDVFTKVLVEREAHGSVIDHGIKKIGLVWKD